MKVKCLFVLSAIVVSCLCNAAPLAAQESAERIAQLERELNQARERRHEIERKLEGFEGDDFVEQQRRLEKAHDELTEVMHHLELQIHGDREGGQPERSNERRRNAKSDRQQELETGRQRLEHMHVAHGHLREAGLDELATQVAQRAERLEHRLNQAESDRQPHARHNDEFQAEVLGAIRELNAAVRSLRNDLNELRRNHDEGGRGEHGRAHDDGHGESREKPDRRNR